MCKYFPRCRHGDDCKYMHIDKEPQNEAKSARRLQRKNVAKGTTRGEDCRTSSGDIREYLSERSSSPDDALQRQRSVTIDRYIPHYDRQSSAGAYRVAATPDRASRGGKGRLRGSKAGGYNPYRRMSPGCDSRQATDSSTKEQITLPGNRRPVPPANMSETNSTQIASRRFSVLSDYGHRKGSISTASQTSGETPRTPIDVQSMDSMQDDTKMAQESDSATVFLRDLFADFRSPRSDTREYSPMAPALVSTSAIDRSLIPREDAIPASESTPAVVRASNEHSIFGCVAPISHISATSHAREGATVTSCATAGLKGALPQGWRAVQSLPRDGEQRLHLTVYDCDAGMPLPRSLDSMGSCTGSNLLASSPSQVGGTSPIRFDSHTHYELMMLLDVLRQSHPTWDWKEMAQ